MARAKLFSSLSGSFLSFKRNLKTEQAHHRIGNAAT
jgi:hypothetical protein